MKVVPMIFARDKPESIKDVSHVIQPVPNLSASLEIHHHSLTPRSKRHLLLLLHRRRRRHLPLQQQRQLRLRRHR